MYVPVVTLSTENDKNFLEQLKSGFKRTVNWSKYRSQMTIQSNNNRLLVLSVKKINENGVNKHYRDSFSHYYVPNVEIKDFNVLIDGKSFFDFQ